MQLWSFQALKTPDIESLEAMGFLLFFWFKGIYLYLLDLGKLIAELPHIKIYRSTKVSLGIISDN